jgi:hypothetical protein
MEMTSRVGKKYLQIKQGEIFFPSNDKSAPNYRSVDWTNKSGETGTYAGLFFDSIKTKIFSIKYFDGKFGTVINIEIEDDYILVLSGRYAAAIAPFIPSIDVSKEVVIRPYDFEDEKKVRRQGISLSQDGKKLSNYYAVKDSNGKLSYPKGFPEPPKPKAGGKITSQMWTLYFRQLEVKFREENENWIEQQSFPNLLKSYRTEDNKKDDFEEDLNQNPFEIETGTSEEEVNYLPF